MACFCGDMMCPSCGPAQGYNPEFEALCEWGEMDLLADFQCGFDTAWLAEELANRLAQQPKTVQDVLQDRQKEWLREYQNAKLLPEN